MASVFNEQKRRMFTAYVFNSLGVMCAAFSLGFFSTGEIGIGPWERTSIGLAMALVLGIAGEGMARGAKREVPWANSWFATNILMGAYSLAYFFVYAAYYVKALHAMDTPYASWVMFLLLGGLAAVHGVTNKHVRWFTTPYTVLLTLHALYNAWISDAVVHLGGHDVKVATLGLVAGFVWCGLLSIKFKRDQLKFPPLKDCKTTDDTIGYFTYLSSHEFFFALAAVCAVLLPLKADLPVASSVCWSWEALALGVISWRNGNQLKHVWVAAVWAIAAWSFFVTPFGEGLPVATIVSVVGVGMLMAMAYRFESSSAKGMDKFRLPADITQAQKVLMYSVYLYAAILLSLFVPYKQFGLWDAMPYLLGAALVICGLGIALRDGLAHAIGVIAAGVAVVLFFGHFFTWNLYPWLVVAVVLSCYGLSFSYTAIFKKGGYKASAFLPYSGEYAVTAAWANLLERVWSWVGCAVALGASYVLLSNHEWTVMLWVPEAILLYLAGDKTGRIGYTAQAMVAFGLAAAKLIVLDMAGRQIGWDASTGTLVWGPELASVNFRAGEFALLGVGFLVASWRDFTWLNKLRAAVAAKATEAAAAKDAGAPAPGPSDENRS